MLSDNYKKVNQVLAIILFANLTVAMLKIGIGNSIKSASMTADGFHSLSDGTSNIIGLIAVFFASRPKDENHPYGHKKIEAIASLIIGLMLLQLAKSGRTIYKHLEFSNYDNNTYCKYICIYIRVQGG